VRIRELQAFIYLSDYQRISLYFKKHENQIAYGRTTTHAIVVRPLPLTTYNMKAKDVQL